MLWICGVRYPLLMRRPGGNDGLGVRYPPLMRRPSGNDGATEKTTAVSDRNPDIRRSSSCASAMAVSRRSQRDLYLEPSDVLESQQGSIVALCDDEEKALAVRAAHDDTGGLRVHVLGPKRFNRAASFAFDPGRGHPVNEDLAQDAREGITIHPQIRVAHLSSRWSKALCLDAPRLMSEKVWSRSLGARPPDLDGLRRWPSATPRSAREPRVAPRRPFRESSDRQELDASGGRLALEHGWNPLVAAALAARETGEALDAAAVASSSTP
jgi:hypothetical protein